MHVDPYDPDQMTYETVIANLINAAGKAGRSSGFVIDVALGMHVDSMNHWKSVALARHDEVRPPFALNALVRAKQLAYYEHEISPTVEGYKPQIPQGEDSCVRVFYYSKGKWYLGLRVVDKGKILFFRAEAFEEAPVVEAAATPVVAA